MLSKEQIEDMRKCRNGNIGCHACSFYEPSGNCRIYYSIIELLTAYDRIAELEEQIAELTTVNVPSVWVDVRGEKGSVTVTDSNEYTIAKERE